MSRARLQAGYRQTPKLPLKNSIFTPCFFKLSNQISIVIFNYTLMNRNFFHIFYFSFFSLSRPRKFASNAFLKIISLHFLAFILVFRAFSFVFVPVKSGKFCMILFNYRHFTGINPARLLFRKAYYIISMRSGCFFQWHSYPSSSRASRLNRKRLGRLVLFRFAHKAAEPFSPAAVFIPCPAASQSCKA